MEGPDIQGPQVWLDLNRKAEAKILDYHKANLERFKWLDQYVEECKIKLGVQVSEEPSFVPKTPGKSKGKAKRGGRRRTTKTDNEETVVVETNGRATRAKANLTVTEEPNPAPSQGKGKAKKSADSEEDPDVQEAMRRSMLEQPPVPSPRASKRTRNVPNSKSSASSSAASADEGSPQNDDEPIIKKASPESDVIQPSEVVNSTIIVTQEEPGKTGPEDNVFIEAEVVTKPSAVDAVRNILSSVEVSMPSPIAAPRKSFRNFSEAEEGARVASKKKSLIPDEVEAAPESMEEEDTESQDDQKAMEVGSLVPSDDNEEVIDANHANATRTVEKSSNISSSYKKKSNSKSSSKSTNSQSSVSDGEAFISMDKSSEIATTLSKSKSQSSSSDFEVPPSSEKVQSYDETVTVNKDDSTEDEADTRPRRTTRTKVIETDKDDSSRRITRTKAKVVSSADEKSDKDEETSRRTTRPKVIASNTNTEPSDKEEETSRRTIRTKVKDTSSLESNTQDETSRRTSRSKVSKPEAEKEIPQRRATRTKAAQSGEESETEEPQAGKRVTRSKVANKTASPEEVTKPTRSTRTLTKKMASSSTLTKSTASPRVRELASRALSPTKSATPPKNIAVGYTGSPIRDRVKVFENAMKESAGLKSSSSEEEMETVPPRTPLRQFFTPKRKSSIANSLRKVSAARNMSVAKVVEEQEVNVVSPPSRKGPVIRKSPGTKKVNLNNSRAPTGKIIKSGANKKVAASGGRGTTPGSGSSTGSNSLIRSRSRMALIDKAGKTTPSGNNGPSNLRVGATSFLQQKPKGPTLEEIQEKKDEERKKKEQREVEARQRREEMLKKKAEESKRARDERIRKVAEARQQQVQKKEKEKEQKVEKERERENQDKLDVLKKKAEMHKEAARKKKEAEEKLMKEEEERETRLEEDRRREQIRKEEENKMERKKQEIRKQEEIRRVAQAKEKERILREQLEMKRVREEAERRAAEAENLNSTYNKPADATFNRTVDQSHVGPSSYDITPARHELPPKPPMTEEDYGLEDLNSGTDTDDEDNPKKKVPKWAEGTALRTALLKQCYMGPDVDKIFYTIQDPDLSVLFGQQHKRYNKRTSSACWDTAPASFNFSKRC